jgi:hypothetical protein
VNKDVMKAGESRTLVGIGLVVSLMLAGTGSYAAARWLVLSQAAAEPSPARRAGVLPVSVATDQGPDRAPLDRPQVAGGAITLASTAGEVELPSDLSPLDNLCLERGMPAVMLRGRLMGELRGWAQAAKQACWREGRADPSELLVRVQVQSAPSLIRVGQIDRVSPYNGAPVAEDVLACVDRELRRRENSQIVTRGAEFPAFEGPVEVRLRLGDGSLCPN